jgi:hypothetical protein
MKTHLLGLIGVLLIALASPLFAQAYYPLAIGNRWDYGTLESPGGFVYSYSEVIRGDTTMTNGKHYAIRSSLGRETYVRQEGMRLFRWVDSTEIPDLDFSVQSGDTTRYLIRGTDTILTTVYVGFGTLFGRRLRMWTYSTTRVNDPGRFESYWVMYTDSIGYSGGSFSPGYREYLLGAIIDGKVYGTITSVELHPDDYCYPTTSTLDQNYPNPFNPSTTIRYSVPERSRVELAVYNSLGQQVAQLINGEIEAGHHDVSFDASALPSGVYFYRLYVGGYSETKRLLVLR